MKLGNTVKAYKKLHRHLTAIAPLYPKYIPRRYKVYELVCGSKRWARRGTRQNSGPVLTVRDIKQIHSEGKDPYGLFATWSPDAIFIDDVCARKFERDPSKYEIGIQYVILHELIHWARHKSKLPRKLKPPEWELPLRGKRKGEAGDEFEYWAYGREMGGIWKS